MVGSLDLEQVLRDGEHAFPPGLLARAHGGVLYVDEVNLLHDHLVDVLLDAAAMGRVHVERDGVSHTHDARFVLVGTMNPEEGELRPQLLDRFGLTVDVSASRDVDVRMEVIRRRLDYEADPEGFAARYDAEDADLARRIAAARALVAAVELPDGELRRIAALCASFDVDGMRADLVLARTATAHAAWRGTSVVEEQDVRVAAELTLPHRRRRDPFDDPGLDPEQLDEALAQAGEPPRPSPSAEPDPDPPGGGGEMRGRVRPEQAVPQGDPSTRAGGRDPNAPRRRDASGPRRWRCPVSARAHRADVRGLGTGPGRRVSATDDPDVGHGLHLFGTLLAAAAQAARGAVRGSVAARRPARRDTRGPRGQSGGLRRRRVRVDGSARPDVGRRRGPLSLLRDAYQRRDKVAVITVRGQRRRTGAAADVVGGHRGPPAGAVRHRRQDPTGGGSAGGARRGGAREGPRPCAPQPGGGAHRRPRHRRNRPAGPRPRAAGLLAGRGRRGRRRRLRDVLVRLGLAERPGPSSWARHRSAWRNCRRTAGPAGRPRRSSAPPDLLAGETFDATGPTARPFPTTA